MPSSPFSKIRRYSLAFFDSSVQSYHTRSSHKPQSLSQKKVFTRNDYLAMLDHYRETYHTDTSTRTASPQLYLPHINTSDTVTLNTPLQNKPSVITSPEEQSVLERVIQVIKDEDSSNEQLYEAYKTLPFPGVSLMDEHLHRILLRRLSVMEKHTEKGISRFLSVVDDMKTVDLPLTNSEWSSAVHLAGRRMARVSAVEVESALRVWKEMEQESGIEGGTVTFNILIDIAAKAGKFVLTEMILKEMRARNLRISRFTHVGMIYYYGLMGDGDGVRRAYRELIDDDQIVDTAILNCVIASLLKAGEPQAADQVYERMKIMCRRSGCKLPPSDWLGSKELGRTLDRAARRFAKGSKQKKDLQNEQSLAPNLRTYLILLAHHISSTGELQRVVTLIDEMQFIGLPVTGTVYLQLFRGFANHGGIRYSAWTRARLESVWTSFQQIVVDRNEAEDQAEDVVADKWIVIWTIRAFAKCCGDSRTLEIWDELRSRWKPTQEEQAMIFKILKKSLHWSGTSAESQR
ncbi:hypothetical protein MMC19_006626 [Ptychographa xylographoides]|nr:hypothetical protein [Ptychographa xylographoides]